MAIDAARGMSYLHNSDPIIIHRDLKSQNLLVDDNWRVKGSDVLNLKRNYFLKNLIKELSYPTILIEYWKVLGDFYFIKIEIILRLES